MTVEPQCYVCGAEVPCINGLCADCTMKEFYDPGAAFEATFGSLSNDDVAVSKSYDNGEPFDQSDDGEVLR